MRSSVSPLCTVITEYATQQSRILVHQRLARVRSAAGYRHGSGWIVLREPQRLLRIGDLGHGGLGEEAAARRHGSFHHEYGAGELLA